MDRKEFNKILDRLRESIDNLRLLASYNGICEFNENKITKKSRTIPFYNEILDLLKDDEDKKENLNKIFDYFLKMIKKVIGEIIEDIKVEERTYNFVSVIKYITDNLEDDDALRVMEFNGNVVIFANGNAIESWIFPDVVLNDSDGKKRLNDAQAIIDSLRGAIRNPKNCPSMMFYKEEESYKGEES